MTSGTTKRTEAEPASDMELVQACRHGDKQAFITIVARHQTMVCGVAFAILNDFAASQDTAQEVFLTAWRKMEELRDAGSNEGSLSALLPATSSALLNSAGGQRGQVWEWLKTQRENDLTRKLRAEVLDSAAYQDMDAALQMAKELSETPEGDHDIKELAGRFLNGGNDLYRVDTLLTQAPERLRQPILEQAFRYLSAETVSESWVKRLSALPEPQRLTATESLTRAWASRAPEEAIEWINTLPDSEQRGAAAAGAANGIARENPGMAAAWVASLNPGPEHDRAAAALIKEITEDQPREAWQWTARIEDSDERERVATYVVKKVAERNPTLAAEWLGSGQFTEKTRGELQIALGLKGATP